ncbi:MAG: hypothetical protein U0X39_06645 [Bacteroidales bacterium]
MKKTLLFFSFFVLFAALNGQETGKSRFSCSLSWNPVYYGPNKKFTFDDVIKTSFGVNIHFRVIDRLNAYTGFGFQEWHRTYQGWSILSTLDPTKSEKWGNSSIKVPLGLEYYLENDNNRFTPYLMSEFVNEFDYAYVKQYDLDELVYIDSSHSYTNSLFLGVGGLIKIDGSMAVITELSAGTNLYEDAFEGYQIRLRIGILLR